MNDCLNFVSADLRMSGIVGSCKMFDLKSELCCVFREGLNHFMSNLSSGTHKYGGALIQKKGNVPGLLHIVYSTTGMFA